MFVHIYWLKTLPLLAAWHHLHGLLDVFLGIMRLVELIFLTAARVKAHRDAHLFFAHLEKVNYGLRG